MPETPRGNKFLLVVQDYFSKWVELFALPAKRAKLIAQKLHEEYFTRYGVPLRLHSDQGKEFDNALIKELCLVWGIKKQRTTAFHPQSNGMVERTNRSVKSLLRMTEDVQNSSLTWDLKLPEVRCVLNNTRHCTTGFSPRQLFMSQCNDARLPVDLFYGAETLEERTLCYHEYIEERVMICQEVAELARRSIGKAMRSQFSGRERAGFKIRDYKAGDWVLRWWPPAANDKLDPRMFDGPYQVKKVDPENNTVKLELPTAGRSKSTQLRDVNMSSIKPVLTDEKGNVLYADAFYIYDL